jgi:hypothetical protein
MAPVDASRYDPSDPCLRPLASSPQAPLLCESCGVISAASGASADYPPAVWQVSQVVLPIRKGNSMSIEKVIYTARAKVMGGRVGTAKSDDGQIDLKLDRPVEMSGKGNGTNPEQLFAVATQPVSSPPCELLRESATSGYRRM